MVAIIEGRDPALVEGAYTSTRAISGDIEPPARHIHIVNKPIPLPSSDPPAEDGPSGGEASDGEKPQT